MDRFKIPVPVEVAVDEIAGAQMLGVSKRVGEAIALAMHWLEENENPQGLEEALSRLQEVLDRVLPLIDEIEAEDARRQPPASRPQLEVIEGGDTKGASGVVSRK